MIEDSLPKNQEIPSKLKLLSCISRPCRPFLAFSILRISTLCICSKPAVIIVTHAPSPGKYLTFSAEIHSW